MAGGGENARLPAGLTAWGLVALYAAVISILSHQARIRLPDTSPDWLAHMVEFAGLGWLTARGLRCSGFRPNARAMTLACLACLGFGALDEAHQSFVPGRFASLMDVIADGAGATIALLFSHWNQRFAGTSARSSGDPPVGHEIVLLGRKGCHLCDEAEATIRAVLADSAGTLTKIDIDDDEELTRAHAREIPIVLIDGRRRFKGRVDSQRLRRLLAAGTRPKEGRGE